jgi:hypothetical protein
LKYIALDIDGWLGGTCARFLTKSEKAIWSDLLVLGGKGKGRFGFIELDKGMPYSRQQLLSMCQCFTDEDINTFDSCLSKCINGTTEKDYTDAPRLIDHNGIYEIMNWDKYQHSDYMQGFTEEECKEAKKQKRDEAKSKLPIERQLGSEFHTIEAVKNNPAVALETLNEMERIKEGKY